MSVTIKSPGGYGSLALAFGAALDQASHGKGSERHAEKDEPFSSQLICDIPRRLGPGGECFCLGQAVKKIYESRRLPPERARAELLGAMNYLAAAWGLLGGFEDVFGEKPEPASEPAKAPENACLDFAERVVSLMKECGIAKMESHDGSARMSADGTVSGFRFVTENFVSAPEDFQFDEDRMAESMPGIVPPAQEDADMPCFQKGELVEYRMPDGTWVPARFAFMDGGYCVLESGGERISVLRFNVREAETA